MMTPAGTWVDRLLPAWFAVWTLARIQSLGWTGSGWDGSFVGRDFRIYRAAGEAVLHGGDPWAASAAWNGVEWHYAAPPTAAQLFVPFALVPEAIGLALVLVLSLGLAWMGLRRLGLPVWWLLFPPLTEGLLAGNPQIALFGLLVVGSDSVARTSIARVLAAGLKSYAIVPVIARREWRAVIACAIGLLVSVVVGLGLWTRYASDAGTISARLVDESQGGMSATLLLRPGVFGQLLPAGPAASVVPWLVFAIVVGLVFVVALRDVRAAGWLVVPLLLPAAEYHLATLAIPIARRWSIWILAIPSVPTYLLGLLLLSWEVAAARPALAREEPAEPLGSWLRLLSIPRVGTKPQIDLNDGRAA
jgi:hypothetical protein